MGQRLVAITHGNPADEKVCGRPLYIRQNETGDLPTHIYACPLHGDVRETKGPTAPFSFFHEDIRARRPGEGG